MGQNMIIALGAALVGFNLGKTAKSKGFLAAAGSLATTALTGYAVYRVMFPVTQQLIAKTLGE